MIRVRMNTSKLAAIGCAIGCLMLSACAEQNRSGIPTTGRVYSADTVGRAKRCSATPAALPDGKIAPVQMKMSGEGGWCDVQATQQNGKPYDAALLVTRPSRGRVLVHRVGDVSRIDYTPNTGATGADRFSVKLTPGGQTVEVAVTVEAP